MQGRHDALCDGIDLAHGLCGEGARLPCVRIHDGGVPSCSGRQAPRLREIKWRIAAKFATIRTNWAMISTMMAKRADLDRFDHALLREVRMDNQTPARILAERIGLSQSAVLRRLRRLRADGIIKADISIVDARILGIPVSIHVLVSIERGSRTSDRFSRKLGNRPEVQHASYVTGGADFVLHLQVESMEAYANFAREVFHDDPDVIEYHTYVEMREVVASGSRR